MGRFSSPGRGGRGRGGRVGRGFDKGKRRENKTPDKSKKFIFTTLESSIDQQVTSYKTTHEKMILDFTSNTGDYKTDLADSLEARADVNIPAVILQTSTATDPGVMAAENEAYRADYIRKQAETRERSRKLADNLRGAYSTIYDKYCDTSMQEKLKSRSDFESKIKHNPYELLRAMMLRRRRL